MDLKEAYKVMQAAWIKAIGLEVGDTVKGVQPFKKNPLGSECTEAYPHNGKGRFAKGDGLGIVKRINQNEIIVNCIDNGGDWSFPFFALEFVEKAKKPEKMVTVKGREYSEDTLQKMIQQYSE
jgi:hypothetical protein